jgi:hypothetical protein
MTSRVRPTTPLNTVSLDPPASLEQSVAPPSAEVQTHLIRHHSRVQDKAQSLLKTKSVTTQVKHHCKQSMSKVTRFIRNNWWWIRTGLMVAGGLVVILVAPQILGLLLL